MRMTELTIKQLHQGLKNKEFSALEVTEQYLQQIEEKDKSLEAYLSVDREGALNTARGVDELIKKGEAIGPLAGVPLAIKDNILIEGQRARAGSKILKDYTAAYDATVIEKLKKENAVFLGKTNLDEFAMGSSTENSGFKITKNPYDLSRVPGGSSGGSAAAVAANMAAGALGSDTGGSIRQPASFCGVVGLKPTYGAVSRYGLIALASSLDQIGPLAKTVEDAALIFRALAGHDSNDATSVPGVDYGDELLNPNLEDLKKLSIGIPEEYFIEGLDSEVAENIEEVRKALESAGFRIKKINLPHTKYALSVYYIILPAEASTNLARYDGLRYGTRGESRNLLELYYENRGQGFGPEAKRRIILGTYVLSAGYYDAYYSKAQRVRTLVKQDFEEAFKSVDVILAPTAPTPAFKIGEKKSPMEMYLSDIFTLPVNLAGLPGVSIPVKGRDGKLSIGFQLVGKPFREADILGVGRIYERS
ncbi:MAG: Asp-tRNA(Asn)/Glu-tRNA(Gln) amidotransferase subunit GatA [Candidatus Colwellbacteria bacterium]|nr:Asp-tRNA(Asn)/Glu-tRNA(Gln) amidotransferase subunit GatA [Candidatus Colwellbacteria bacterium]